MLLFFNEHLVPEITGGKKNGYTLIINCDGFRQGIPAVEGLTEGVSEYGHWKIVKYRQPGAMEFIPINGHKVRRKYILLTWDKTSAGNFDLTFHLRWPQNSQSYRTGAILHLDHTIGEYAAMIRIEGVKFKNLGLFQAKKGLKTLDDLKAEIDKSH